MYLPQTVRRERSIGEGRRHHLAVPAVQLIAADQVRPGQARPGVRSEMKKARCDVMTTLRW